MLRSLVLLFLAVPAFANIIGVDSRRSILDADKRRALDISDADAIRFGNASGYVDCRGAKFNNPELGSGALVEEEDILVTNSHLLVDELRRRRDPLEECFFQPQTANAERYHFSLEPGSYEIVTDWTAFGGWNDYAVIRLKSKVKNAKAFPLPPIGFQLANGQSVVTISAMATKPQIFNPLFPVIQGCQVKQFQFGDANRNSTYLGDCDVEPGQSGSIDLVRLMNGEWIGVGIVAGSGSAADGVEYSVEKKSYSFHVAFRDNLVSAIKRIKRSSTLTSLTR